MKRNELYTKALLNNVEMGMAKMHFIFYLFIESIVSGWHCGYNTILPQCERYFARRRMTPLIDAIAQSEQPPREYWNKATEAKKINGNKITINMHK